ncbi:HAD family hydrolase [Salisaeta longa]|uniref:HAD family hydrolase n=1 Tax=Salisaeta longa TaxID=503170 RepID=UPI00041F645C|nr:HAD family hydrolase [Salisaeta longa]
MVSLFITDIDGCLAEPYQPYDLSGFQALADLAADPSLLPLSICSGRAYAYVEAVTQALGLTTPVLFESGGGLFDPQAAQITWNPAFTDDVAAALETMRHWFATEAVPGTKLSIDHAKRTQAGVVTPDTSEIRALRPRVLRFVEATVPQLTVFTTDNSIDVVPPTINKRTGIAWLSDQLGIPMEQIAYIGDTDADLPALEAVGYPFAPANAHGIITERIPRVTEGRVIDGTLEAYRWCVAHNTTGAPDG